MFPAGRREWCMVSLPTHRLWLPASLFLLAFCAPLSANDPDVDETTEEQSSSPSAPSVAGSTYRFPTRGEVMRNYALSMIGPGAFFRAGFSGALDQYNNVPPDWQQGAEGYSKRFASRFGQNAIAQTTRYGASALLRQDTSYQRCACSGPLRRAAYALGSTFTARTRSGRVVPSVPNVAAPYVGALAAVPAWYPARYNASDAFRFGTIGLASQGLFNLVREFVRR